MVSNSNGLEKNFFNRFAKKHGSYEVYPDDEYMRIIKSTEIVLEDKNKKVLDIGCGSGAFSFRLAKMGFNVVGIDLSEELIDLAIKKNAIEQLNIKFIMGNILNMHFPDEFFDIIFCSAVFHHISKKLYKCAAELYRVLHGGGKVYFFEPYYFCINSLLRYNIFCFNRTKDEKALNPKKLKKAFEQTGFINFQFKKLFKIRHVYFSKQDHVFTKIIGNFRKILNEYLVPNVFFAGSCKK